MVVSFFFIFSSFLIHQYGGEEAGIIALLLSLYN